MPRINNISPIDLPSRQTDSFKIHACEQPHREIVLPQKIYTANLLTLQYLKYIAYQENTETRNKMHSTNDYAAASVVSNSVRPHRWQPTRLRCPWDSPDKNTGVGCHFLLQCMKVKK